MLQNSLWRPLLLFYYFFTKLFTVLSGGSLLLFFALLINFLIQILQTSLAAFSSFSVTFYDILNTTPSELSLEARSSLSFIFLALHLLHGFGSSFKTVGVDSKYYNIIKSFTLIFSIIIPFGFIFIALFHNLMH